MRLYPWDLLYDPASIGITLIAVFVICYGSRNSVAKRSAGSSAAAQAAQGGQDMKLLTAILLPVFASVVLIVLFLVLGYAYWVLLALMSFSALLCSYLILAPFVDQLLQLVTKKPIYFKLPNLSWRIPLYTPFTLLLNISILVLWYTTHSWIVVNGLGIMLAMAGVSFIKIPNLKISLVLLTLFFFYDIFWVFISPFIFKKSVMVTVARDVTSKKIPLPMLIQVPSLLDMDWNIFNTPLPPSPGLSLLHYWYETFQVRHFLNSVGYGQPAALMVGLGDIVLPGSFLCFLYRFDLAKKLRMLRGYFLPAMIGYTLGLQLTVISLLTLQKGEPALLFIVPSILLPTIIIAWKRGHLKDMWNGNGRRAVVRATVDEAPLLSQDEDSDLDDDDDENSYDDEDDYSDDDEEESKDVVNEKDEAEEENEKGEDGEDVSDDDVAVFDIEEPEPEISDPDDEDLTVFALDRSQGDIELTLEEEDDDEQSLQDDDPIREEDEELVDLDES